MRAWWRAIGAWAGAVLTPTSLIKDMAALPYVGAPVSVDAKGRITAHPARSVGDAKKNLRRLAHLLKEQPHVSRRGL